MFIIEPGGSSGDWKTSEGIASGRRPERRPHAGSGGLRPEAMPGEVFQYPLLPPVGFQKRFFYRKR